MAVCNSQVVGLIEVERPARARNLAPQRRTVAACRVKLEPTPETSPLSVIAADVDRLSDELDSELMELMQRLANRRVS